MKALFNQFNPSEGELALSRFENEIDTPLPPQFGFLNHNELLSRLEEALDQKNPILLEGSEGIGKTTLAMMLARRRSSPGQSCKAIIYFDFQECASLDWVQDRLNYVFASQLKVNTQGAWVNWDKIQQLESLRKFLSAYPCLLICDHLNSTTFSLLDRDLPLLSFLEGFSGTATQTILISEKFPENWLSQVPRHKVSGLPLPDAQSLALTILKATGFTPRKIASLSPYQDLLLQLECNPLALQIVLPDLLHKEPAAIQQELRRLAQNGDNILQLALRYRFETLDPLLRKRLAVLGLFRGCISARILTAMASLEDAPHLISALDREQWLRLLETFAEMGLARRVGEGYFLIHASIQTCLTRLFNSELQAEQAWLEKSFCQVCGRAGNQLFKILQANPSFGQSLLLLEERNLLRAYQLALGNKDFSAIREVLCGLRAALTMRGRWTEWDDIVTQLESLISGPNGQASSVDELLWLRLLGHRAEICEYRRNVDHLHQIQQQLRCQYALPPEIQAHEHILDDLGAIARTRGLFEEAGRFYSKSLALKEIKGDESGQALVLMLLGELGLSQRKYRDAEKWLSKSLEIWTRLRQVNQQAILYERLADLAKERGELEKAKSLSNKGHALREASHGPESDSNS